MYWGKLTLAERADLRIFAVRADLPDEGGIRFYLTESDMNFNIKELLQAGKTGEAIISALTCDAFSKTRLKALVKAAEASLLASGLVRAANIARDEIKKGRQPNLAKICISVGLDPKHAPQLLVSRQWEPERGAMSFKSTRAKQKAIREAGDSVAIYLRNILEWTRNHQTPPAQKKYYHMTKDVAIRLTNELVANAEDVLRSTREGLARVENLPNDPSKAKKA